MISAVAKTSAISPCLSAVSQVVPSVMRPMAPLAVQKAQKFMVQARPDQSGSNFSLSKSLLSRNTVVASTGLSSGSQVRLAHTDVQVPDFSEYRRDAVKDPSSNAQTSHASRKGFTYLMVAGGSMAAAYGGKTLAQEFITTMSASADVLAMAKIEIDLGAIAEGKSATFKWRNKPLFVRHRTADEISKEEAVDVASLRDQQHDSERVQKPEWLILLGVCTHLGCVPVNGLGDYGGYYCPCHGSHYDASGRIRKGPAPLNLEVPEYSFLTETTLVVG